MISVHLSSDIVLIMASYYTATHAAVSIVKLIVAYYIEVNSDARIVRGYGCVIDT